MRGSAAAFCGSEAPASREPLELVGDSIPAPLRLCIVHPDSSRIQINSGEDTIMPGRTRPIEKFAEATAKCTAEVSRQAPIVWREPSS